MCIACGIQYNSMHGMHYHLNSTKCGFGAKEKVTPKTNYQEFYTKVESSFFCNRCDFRIEYLQGIHRHLRICAGIHSASQVHMPNVLEDTSDDLNQKIKEEKVFPTSNELATNFFETTMNYIGHDESL